MPAASSGKATFSRVVRQGKVDSSWKTMPIERCEPRTTSPSTRTPPSYSSIRPPMMLKRVVLPQPDGPMMETNSPACTSKEKFSMASTGPSAVSNCLETFSTARAGMVVASMRVTPAPSLLPQPLDLARHACIAKGDEPRAHGPRPVLGRSLASETCAAPRQAESPFIEAGTACRDDIGQHSTTSRAKGKAQPTVSYVEQKIAPAGTPDDRQAGGRCRTVARPWRILLQPTGAGEKLCRGPGERKDAFFVEGCSLREDVGKSGNAERAAYTGIDNAPVLVGNALVGGQSFIRDHR